MADNEKILIVEDDVSNAVLFKRLLIKEGYDITVAYNGKEAIELLDHKDFDA